jgi:hypothetical protein
VKITFNNGVFFLAGRLDDSAQFDKMIGAPAPLKMNLGGITSINSVGVRKFLGFSLNWSPKKFEFYECTPEFIANVNVIPQMLGAPADERQIRSFYVPYSCESCKRIENVLFDREQITVDAHGEVVMPPRKCSKCGESLDLDVEKTEYFMFLRGDAP